MKRQNNNSETANMPVAESLEIRTREIEAIDSCREGNLEDFGLLYDSYVKKIYDFIYFKTHHKETAEDLTSQVFMKALENISKFNSGKGHFSSWLYRIATNAVIDHYRTKKTEFDIDDAWDLRSNDDVFRDVANKEKFEKVQKYLEGIKTEHRDIIMLRVWNELSYKEISEIVGKSEDNCKMIFSRVVSKIKKEQLLVFLAMVLMK